MVIVKTIIFSFRGSHISRLHLLHYLNVKRNIRDAATTIVSIIMNVQSVWFKISSIWLTVNFIRMFFKFKLFRTSDKKSFFSIKCLWVLILFILKQTIEQTFVKILFRYCYDKKYEDIIRHKYTTNVISNLSHWAWGYNNRMWNLLKTMLIFRLTFSLLPTMFLSKSSYGCFKDTSNTFALCVPT